MTAMLDLVPARPPGEGAPVQLATYADVAAQLAAVGVTPPQNRAAFEADPSWGAAIRGLALPDVISSRVLVPEWRETMGFDAFQIDQSLEVGEPPNMTTVLRGRFDEEELRAAWARAGYREVEVDGVRVASLAADGEVDLQNPVNRLALARLNNAAFLADGTLVYASTLDALRATIAVTAGREPSLADRVDVAALLGSVEAELASALLLSGSAVGGGAPAIDQLLTPETDRGALATALAEIDRMPPVSLLVIGVTAGGPVGARGGPEATATPPPADQPWARVEIGALMLNDGAAQAAAEVVAERLATESTNRGRPYAELFPRRSVRIAASAPVVLIELIPAGEVPAGIWLRLVFERDLRFLAW
jgi:hypothetical protein